MPSADERTGAGVTDGPIRLELGRGAGCPFRGYRRAFGKSRSSAPVHELGVPV